MVQTGTKRLLKRRKPEGSVQDFYNMDRESGLVLLINKSGNRNYSPGNAFSSQVQPSDWERQNNTG
jgi:hypothetical protein